MSASAQTRRPHAKPLGPHRARQARQAQRRELARTGALVVLAILITLFAVFNLKEVKVNWVFGSGKAPLIIVIVISVLVGIVLDLLRRTRPRKRR